MNTQFLIIYGLFLVSILLSKNIKKKADAKLSDHKRIQLADLMNQDRGFSLIFLGGLVVLYILNLFFELINQKVAINIFFSLAIIFLLFNTFRTYTKISKADFKKDYIKSYLYSSIVQFVGFVSLYVGMISVFWA